MKRWTGDASSRRAGHILVLLCIAWPLATASSAGAALPTGFQDTKAVFEGLGHPGLDEPTVIRFSSSGQVFIAQRTGRILVYDSLSDPSPTVFADLRTEVYDNGDRGILGMTLDPEFPAQPYVYLLYTYDHLLGDPAPAPKWGAPGTEGDPCPKPADADVDACPVSGRLVRLTAEGDHAAPQASAPAQKVLVEDWCQQFSSHSIGDLHFGPEGALFASAGEGASFNSADYGQFGWPQKNQCGDPPGNVGEALKPPAAEGGSLRAQNTKNLDGSVIRIDPDTGLGMADNPMAASSDANRRRITAYGFRNPFRFAIDPETHEVYVANVGWGTYEEIDRFATVPSTAYNSGWPCYEGPNPTPAFQSLGLNVCEALYSTPGSTSAPFFFYTHGQPVTPEDPCPNQFGSSITGIDFYEGNAFPSYEGALFFADSVRGCIYVMLRGEDGRPDPSTTKPFLTDGGYPGVDIEEGPEGALYYTMLFEGGEYAPHSGSIHKITYASGNQPPIARLSVDKEWGQAPLLTHLDASGSTDADGEALSYEWDLTGSGSFSAPGSEATKQKTFNDSANHVVAVRVKDTKGASSVARVTIYPGDTPPQPVIAEPSPSVEWTVGQALHLKGSASDTEDGSVPSTSLDWNSRLYHCPSACHVHPLQAFPSVAEGTLVMPDHDLPSHIELTLTATDSRGLEASKSIDLNPKPVGIALESEPGGVTLTAGQLTQPAPYSISVIQGSKFTVSAPVTAEVGATTYAFDSWSDGGERVHTVTADAAGTYTAAYAPQDGGGGTVVDSPPTVITQPTFGPAVEAPQTSITRHPARRTSRTTAKFRFSASEASSQFRCRLDERPVRPCTSPWTYRHLQPGWHVFRVAALGGSSRVDATPAQFRWWVEERR